MRNQRPKPTAIKALLFAALLLATAFAWAGQVAGTVVHLSGPLMARKADGTVKVLALKSEVESGDTLVSEKNTYAQLRFVDNSEITLRPGTTFKIENFAYDAAKPEADSAAFSLVKGGLRSITGLLGKRNKDKFSMKTPSATIGIRGTTFVVQYVSTPPATGGPGGAGSFQESVLQMLGNGSAQGKAPPAGGDAAAGKVARGPDGPPASPVLQPVLPPGLHLQVLDGAIVVTNNGGSLGFQAGQFGYVPSVNQPPVIVPANPGLHFVPPPSFGSGPTGPVAAGGVQDPGAVDCIVR
jgi:hypothetical protein